MTGRYVVAVFGLFLTAMVLGTGPAEAKTEEL